jgi:hypothetical protein
MDKASAFRDNAHAVIIGINQYEDKSIPDLNFARADAEAIYNGWLYLPVTSTKSLWRSAI